MAALKLSFFWWSRKLTSLRSSGASALPPLTIFHSLSALQPWQHCTQIRHRLPQRRRCCIPADTVVTRAPVHTRVRIMRGGAYGHIRAHILQICHPSCFIPSSSACACTPVSRQPTVSSLLKLRRILLGISSLRAALGGDAALLPRVASARAAAECVCSLARFAQAQNKSRVQVTLLSAGSLFFSLLPAWHSHICRPR